MDARGNIHELDPEDEKKLRDLFEGGNDPGMVPIPEEELEAIRGMNRKQRRAWYAKRKRELRRERRHIRPASRRSGVT